MIDNASRSGRSATWLTQATAWSCYATLGLEYAVFAIGLAVGAWHLLRSKHWPALASMPGYRLWLSLWALLLVSLLWTSAKPAHAAGHLWGYGLVLLLPVLMATWTPASARRALQHFVVASAGVGALNLLFKLGVLPSHVLWQRLVDAEGNQRIAISLLLSLGAVLGLREAMCKAGLHRGAWLLACLLCVAGLALQDRRSGMLTLPVMLAVWVLARQPSWWRRAGLMAALAVAVAAGWSAADGVRARFTEGLAELQAPGTVFTATSSWGQRLHMLQITAEMVKERPWLGHGIASWRPLWQQRTPVGTALHAHSTPHNEYLLMATQTGAVGALLLILALATAGRSAWHRGPAGTAALLIWTLLATACLFNAALRDAKFSLPLLTLAALANAAAGSPKRLPS